MYKIFARNKALILTDNQHFYKENVANVFIQYHFPDDLKNAIENLEELNSIILFHNSLEELWAIIASNYRIIEAAGGKVINNKKDILFIERFNKWDLPKGKKELNETSESTAIREVQEECGLSNLTIVRPLETTLHTYKIGSERIIKKTKWFLMNYTGNEELIPQKEEGITAAKWFPENQLAIPLSNTYKSILELFN